MTETALSTAAATDLWRRRAAKYGREWADMYWRDQARPSRKIVADAVAKCGARSVLELGCNSGPMLAVLARAIPGIELTGIDVAPEAVKAAHELIPRAKISCWDVGTWLPIQLAHSAGAFDIVLTHYTLAYVDANDIRSIIRDSARVARLAVICAEPHAASPHSFPLSARLHEWAHPYPALFAEAGLRDVQTVNIETTTAHDRLNGMTVGRVM